MASSRWRDPGRDRLVGLCRAASALAAEHELQPVLQLIVASAADLCGARYTALGVYDNDGQIRIFVHHRVDAAAVDRIGRLPRGRGLLGAAIVADAPIRIDDIAADPRSRGFPAHHRTPLELTTEGLADGTRLPAEQEIAAYRVVQEALTNAMRHAGAERVKVIATCAPRVVRVIVMDDGIGFDPAAVGHRSLGLAGMRERMTLAGGLLSIDSRPGNGTRVVAEVPIG